MTRTSSSKKKTDPVSTTRTFQLLFTDTFVRLTSLKARFVRRKNYS